jgi:hypothetical protein
MRMPTVLSLSLQLVFRGWANRIDPYLSLKEVAVHAGHEV